jgi:hypothetical protein
LIWRCAQVMCDCYAPNGEPIPSNKRHGLAKIFNHPGVKAEEPWSVKLQHFDTLFVSAFDLIVYKK